MNNQILFIGTSSGKTSLKRFHSSLLLNTEKFRLLIDAGDSVSRALLKQKIDLNNINAILISHFHADHYSGLASLVTQMHLSKRKNSLKIFVHKSFVKQIKIFLNQSYLFEEKLTFNLTINGYDFGKEIELDKNLSFTPKQNSHIRNKRNLKNYNGIKFISSSFLFSLNDKKIFYTSDVGNKEDLYLFDLSKIDLLISEVTHIDKEIFQKTLTQFENLQIYLTHYDDNAFDELKSWRKSFSKSDLGRLKIAKDGMKIL